MKVCTKCKISKPLSAFYADKRKKDGKQSRCSKCQAEDKRLWYERDPEAKKRKAAYDKQYVERDREKKNRDVNRWNAENREKRRAMSRRWKKQNKHKVNSYTKKRQAVLKQRCPPWLSKDQEKEIQNYYWLACDIEKITGETYHVDHIVPLQGKTVCGLHVPWNLQVLPSDVNEKKGNKWDQT